MSKSYHILFCKKEDFSKIINIINILRYSLCILFLYVFHKVNEFYCCHCYTEIPVVMLSAMTASTVAKVLVLVRFCLGPVIECRVWGLSWGQISVSFYLICVTLDKLVNHPEPKFPQQKNGALKCEESKSQHIKYLTHSVHWQQLLSVK